MEDRKDIGKVIQKAMEKGNKSPQASLWNRLDDSLEKRAKKRRRVFWLWFGAIGFLLLLVAGIWGFSNSSIPSNNSIISTSSENDLNVNPSEKDTQETILTTPENKVNDTLLLIEDIQNKTTLPKHIITKTPSAEVQNEKNQPTNKKISEVRKINTIQKNTTEAIVVTTKHLYYNSDIDSTIVSTSKSKIDSLVEKNKRIMASKDSIARARAADSIKINKKRLDSIQN